MRFLHCFSYRPWPGAGQLARTRGSQAGQRPARSLSLECLESRVLPGFLTPLGFDPGGSSVAVADFRHNGILDLAKAGGGNVSVQLGNGDGTFQPAVNYATGDDSVSVAVGDFRHNGILDLAVANSGLRGTPSVSVLLGNGDGTFQPAANYAAGIRPESVAVGDFRDNGILDLAVANANRGATSGYVSVLLGNGDGTFQPAVNYGAEFAPVSVAVGVFRHNGILDLAVANAGGRLSVLLGNGDGTFQPAVNYTVGQSPLSVAVGDFRNNGILDVVVAHE